MARTEAEAAPGAEVGPSWDPVVRVTHWSVAAAVLLNGIVTEGGGRIHVWIGYAAFALLALRLIWGLIGPEEARFLAFPPSFSAALSHVGDMLEGRRRAHRSHNPLGALMVYALWGTLLIVASTGIAMSGAPFAPPAGVERGAAGYAAREYSEHGEDHDEGEKGEDGALGEIHEIAANLLLLLAALHVGGVALESRLSGRNLVRPMVTGGRGGDGP